MVNTDIFTTAGKGWVASSLDTINTWIGWGTGGGTAALADTTLFTEAAEARVATTKTNPSATVQQWVGTITSLSAQTITNAGVLSALTNGTLITHSSFTGIPVAIGDQIQFTFQLTIA